MPTSTGLFRLTPVPGDNCSDLDLSDAGSVTSDDESGSSSESEDTHLRTHSRASSATSLSSLNAPLGLDNAADAEFLLEVRASLDRAFAEGHSVDNAAVELKTLRMASNVELGRVREAVIRQIVEAVRIVEDAAGQRTEIARVVGRWGALIDRIGGVNPVETVSLLQVGVFFSRGIGMEVDGSFVGPVRCDADTAAAVCADARSAVSERYSGGGRYPGVAQVA